MNGAQLVFLPWLREGVGAQLTAPDGSAEVRNTGILDVGLTLNQRTVPVKPVHVLGPGDVVGIDARQVIRTEPTPGSTSVEPNQLVCLELDSPSLPWLFTPAAPGTDHERLRPWLCLVVVRVRDGVTLVPDAAQRATVLRIRRPAVPDEELPDLAQAWAWAHVQLAGVDPSKPENLLTAVQTAPERVLSRLICPRQLEPATRYLACLVPTFAAGRDAALGRPVDPDAPLAPAWSPGDAEVTLPVYHTWEFATGEAGDFASLVHRLRGCTAPAGVGERILDVSAAGAPAGTTLPAAGALRRPDVETATAAPDAVRAHLAALLGGDADDVRPPVYAGTQANATKVPADTTGWVGDLNLDPRWRAAAALGAALVREDQETLVAAAWQQAGAVLEANALIARAQLAAQANASLLRRRLTPLPADQLLEVTAPLHDRVRMSPTTLASLVSASDRPDITVSAAYRRISRPGGPLDRRRARASRPAPGPRPATEKPATATTAVPKTLAAAEKLLAPLMNAALSAPTLSAPALAGPAAEPTVSGAAPAPTLPLEAVRRTLLTRLDPEARVADRVAARLAEDPGAPAAVPTFIAPAAKPATPQRATAKATATRSATTAKVAAAPTPAGDAATILTPRRAAPSYDVPLYAGLARLSPDAVLPGAELVPPDSVMLLRSDPAFVAAFLAGFNTELTHELVWRGYPVDPTATFARTFWDYRGRTGTPEPDVPPIGQWPRPAALSEVATTAGGGDQLVLVLRGELLRRYPRSLVYAVRAGWTDAGSRVPLDERIPANVQQATFSGLIDPDLRFFGFDLTAEQAHGSGTDPGWFFAFQEQATEARFGGQLPGLDSATSADVAVATRRPPVRVLLHADALLAGTSPEKG